MKIAITQRIDFIQTRNEYRDSIDQALNKLLIQSGFIPVLVPNSLVTPKENKKLIEWINIIKPSGLVLSGGNDIGQYLNRDKTEQILYSWFLKKNLPILGICRGMQLIGVLNGSNLKKVKNHLRTKHKIINNSNGDVRIKNSFHLFSLKTCPEDFELTFHSSDNQIEGIKHIKKNIYGIMWHPERSKKFMEDDINLIKNIFGKTL